MIYCQWNDDAQETGLYTCQHCTQRTMRIAPSQRLPNVRRVCKNPPPPLPDGILQHEARELFGDSDPTLWGNQIKALTDAIGIPSCGGCEKRRQWLNKAHAWLRGQ
jgi:hypothetical protein